MGIMYPPHGKEFISKHIGNTAVSVPSMSPDDGSDDGSGTFSPEPSFTITPFLLPNFPVHISTD